MELETKAVTISTRTLSSQSKNCWLFIHVGTWAFWFWRFWRMDNKDGGMRFDYFGMGRREERRKSANHKDNPIGAGYSSPAYENQQDKPEARP